MDASLGRRQILFCCALLTSTTGFWQSFAMFFEAPTQLSARAILGAMSKAGTTLDSADAVSIATTSVVYTGATLIALASVPSRNNTHGAPPFLPGDAWSGPLLASNVIVAGTAVLVSFAPVLANALDPTGWACMIFSVVALRLASVLAVRAVDLSEVRQSLTAATHIEGSIADFLHRLHNGHRGKSAFGGRARPYLIAAAFSWGITLVVASPNLRAALSGGEFGQQAFAIFLFLYPLLLTWCAVALAVQWHLAALTGQSRVRILAPIVYGLISLSVVALTVATLFVGGRSNIPAMMLLLAVTGPFIVLYPLASTKYSVIYSSLVRSTESLLQRQQRLISMKEEVLNGGDADVEPREHVKGDDAAAVTEGSRHLACLGPLVLTRTR